MPSSAQLFSHANAPLDLDVADRAALFAAVAQLWQAQHPMPATDAAGLLSARETLGSTGLGRGVAIPHARCKELTSALVAFVRTRTPIEFDAPDGLPVDCFVLMLAPEKAAQAHLDLLGQIATSLSRADVRDALRSAKSADDVVRAFAPAPVSGSRPSPVGA
jgi:PTS system nitrogen regulatory IIA component